MSTELMPVVLDETSVERIARRLLELQQLLAPAPVLTVKDACEFVRVGSPSSLERWVNRYAPNARCGQGRYTRAALMKGRDKEARGFALPKAKASE